MSVDLFGGEDEKLAEFTLPIQGGLLDNLGINMYANLGKVLVEFAANAYDSESGSVDINLDAAAIIEARAEVRRQVIARAKAAGQKTPTFVDDPLPSTLTVVITDKGLGMTPKEVQEKFLPINRNRRRDDATGEESNSKTETGKRYVMGRKGIGKLSGFGAAAAVVVRTKRKGSTFATKFTLLLSELRTEKDLAKVKIIPVYEPGQPVDEQGTTLTLSDLKCDSMKFREEDLHEALAEAFYPISHQEFAITINGQPINRLEPEYEFIWPVAREVDGFSHSQVGNEEIGILPFKYVAKFRKRSLQAYKRGARIYCNGRLAFGPSLLSLNTGTHNFMAHQYMEFIVEADELDRQNVDLISTDRGDIIRNNDQVDAFLAKLTELMQTAIAAQGRFREDIAEIEFQEDPGAEEIRRVLKRMPMRQQTSGKKIVNIIVARYGIDSDEFRTITPLIVTSMNAGEVLVDLIKAANDPRDVEQLAGYLLELAQIEKSDALKVYRGRRDGIAGLRKLIERGEVSWNKGKRTEGELHALLKEAPWLIRADLTSYLASDRQMHKVISTLARELKIDEFAAAPASEEAAAKDIRRPDLVFLLGNGIHPDRVLIVELKSTNIPLEIEHLNQLEDYIRKVSDWFETEHAGQARKFVVQGVLIGAMPDPKTKSDAQLNLLRRVDRRSANEEWEVVGLWELLARTEAVHRELIQALEDEEKAQQAEGEAALPKPVLQLAQAATATV